MLHTNATECLSPFLSEIEFTISKPVDACTEMCWVKWKVNSRDESKSWRITDDCAQQCGSPKLQVEDVECDDGMNKWHDSGDSSIQKRGGYCTWRMPFTPANDDPPPPPAPLTRSSRWTMDVVQWMQYEESFLTVWLTDPNGNVGKHIQWDTSKDDDGATKLIKATDHATSSDVQMRYSMLLTLYGLRKKEDSTLRITYQSKGTCGACIGRDVCPYLRPQCQPFYQTESTDEKQQALLEDCSWSSLCLGPFFKDDSEFSCDKVADAYYPKGAGFERRFKCWWPHDFVEPYGNQEQAGYKGDGAKGATGFEGIDAGVNGPWANVTLP